MRRIRAVVSEDARISFDREQPWVSVLFWLACVMFLRMHGRVVFCRLQMRKHFRRHTELLRQALFEQRRQAMRLADRHGMREQQVYLNDLPIPCSAETYTVILQSQVAANGIQLAPDFASDLWV